MAVPRNAVGRFGPGGRGVSFTDIVVIVSVIAGLSFVTVRIMHMGPIAIWSQPDVAPATTSDVPPLAVSPPPPEAPATEQR